MQSYFIFKGIKSTEKGIIINKMPELVKPEKNVEVIEVPGRSGNLHIDSETYKPYLIQIECTLLNIENLREVMSWLDGKGNLILSNSPDKFYEAYIMNQIDFTSIVNKIHTFPLQLEIQPFAKSNEVYVKKYRELQKFNFNISNSTAKIKPNIKITGTGKINLNINNQIIIINLTENETIEIDCELQMAYFENKNKNNKILGDLSKIYLSSGINKVEIIGKYTEIEIKYRKVYL